MPSIEMPDSEPAVRRLKRGLMTGDERTALGGYLEIYEAGARAVSIVANELEKFDLKTPMRQEAARLFAGLLALHRDLDETVSDAFIDRWLRQKCSDVTAALLRSARRMSRSDFRIANFGSIEIWEHRRLDERYLASVLVQEWLAELPDKDLSGIHRVYVLPLNLDDDWSGQYLPGLAVVTLAWTTVLPPASRFNRLLNKSHRYVLFHEVGHHMHRHWFGQDPVQEAQADAYAARAMKKSMPVWMRLILPVLVFMVNFFGWCEPPPPAKKILRRSGTG